MTATRSRPRWRWVRRAALALVLLAVALLVATWTSTARFAAFGGRPSETVRARMMASGRHHGGAFHNEELTSTMKAGAAGAIREWLFGDQMRAPRCPLPMATDTARRLANPPSSGLRVTWLGHSTVLIEIDGVRILTDPMWSERASPSTIAGPRRFHPPPLSLEAVPLLDAIVISHDHYDHLDMATIQTLAARGTVIHAPLGVGAHLLRWGVVPSQIVEHDWGEPSLLPREVRLVSTPARHFSGRRPLLKDETLWTSWTIVGPRHRVFFSGDTGLSAAFSRIADQLGPFDLALLEIGQYHPSWGDIHLGPLGALEAFGALRAKKLVPIHWSTFMLGFHGWSEPAEILTVEAERRGAVVLTPTLGEPLETDQDVATPRWWRRFPPAVAHCP